MTKRHHATNYHRCSRCGQPLVKERTMCVKCLANVQDAITRAAHERAIAASQALVCSQCGGDPYCKPGCPNGDPTP